MAKKNEAPAAIMEGYSNPLMAALRENDKKNLFRTNVTTAFLKTGFPLYDYYFGAVINIHDEKGNFVRQEPRVGQAAGTFNLIIGNTGTGKAQPVDTVVPTPDGWKRIGDLQVDDYVFGENGRMTKVIGVFPQGEKTIWHVVFESGRTTSCCADHLWNVQKGNGAFGYDTMSLADIIETEDGYHQYRFPKLNKPVLYNTKMTSADPYLVGLIYTSSVLDKAGYIVLTKKKVAKTVAFLLNAHVLKMDTDQYVIYMDQDMTLADEFPNDLVNLRKMCGESAYMSKPLEIPMEYLINDVKHRKKLLTGIFDSCGILTRDENGDVVVDCRVYSHYIASSISELCRSLGMDTSMYARGNQIKMMHDLNDRHITYVDVRVHVPYKDLPDYFTYEYKKTLAYIMTNGKTALHDDEVDHIKYIAKDIETECVCIKVENASGLYITHDFIITHNTTLGAQISANIIRPYQYSNVVHFDGENRFDVSRCETITRLPAYFFDGSMGGERYLIRSGMVGLDVIQEMIVKTYVSKMKLKDQLMVPSGFKDEFGKDVMIFQPTIVLIDSMTTVLSETFNPDNAKEANDAEKMRGNTEGARDAKTLKGFFKDILPLCKEANIIVYGINHINSNMSMNAFIPPVRQQNYLGQDEIIPGGKTMIYYPFNIIKLTAKPGDDFVEESDGFAGHMVMVEPIKSSSNQSGNKRKGVSFDLVFSHKQGFDSLRSTILYGRDYGIVEGNKTRLKFKDDPSFTFALKSIYKEKDEKPIWESIKKFIIPHLMSHLSFVEPLEQKFDDRSMDY